MQLLRKISAATVIGGADPAKDTILELVMADKSKSHALYRVIGIANDTREGAGKEGFKDWRALLGNFQATNAITGEVFRSGVCFMPQFVVDDVAGQLAGDVEFVKFAYDIGAHFSSKSATSYEYDATPLMQPAADDPLIALANLFSQPNAAALPAPDDKKAKKA